MGLVNDKRSLDSAKKFFKQNVGDRTGRSIESKLAHYKNLSFDE